MYIIFKNLQNNFVVLEINQYYFYLLRERKGLRISRGQGLYNVSEIYVHSTRLHALNCVLGVNRAK